MKKLVKENLNKMDEWKDWEDQKERLKSVLKHFGQMDPYKAGWVDSENDEYPYADRKWVESAQSKHPDEWKEYLKGFYDYQRKNENLKENLETQKNYYWRLPKKVIGNELYPAQKSLKSLYDTLSAGNDLNMEHLDNIIEKLNRVKEAASAFEVGKNPARGFE